MTNPNKDGVPEGVRKFRKKPVVIEAVLWDGNMTTVEPLLARSSTEEVQQELGDPSLYIPTLEGVMKADVGDWIICGVKGELYPCKPDIFEATYDEAALAAALPFLVQPQAGIGVTGALIDFGAHALEARDRADENARVRQWEDYCGDVQIVLEAMFPALSKPLPSPQGEAGKGPQVDDAYYRREEALAKMDRWFEPLQTKEPGNGK